MPKDKHIAPQFGLFVVVCFVAAGVQFLKEEPNPILVAMAIVGALGFAWLGREDY